MSERTARVEARIALPNASRGRQADGGARPRGTARTRRGQQTREQLLDAARVVFERDGFLHARVADICDQAGTSHGSFYTYFVSKEEVFREIVDSVELDLLTVERAAVDADPVERIRAANRHYLHVYAANAGIMRVIHQVATMDVDVWRVRSQRQNAFAQTIERRIRQLQQAGIADPAVNATYAAQALGGMVAHFAELLFNSRDPVTMDAETATEELTRLWRGALGIRDQSRPDGAETEIGAEIKADVDQVELGQAS
ncbi:TetR/AcrR family transcriptional regulator [Frankia sp. CNm7]|uniref:TetR/AcrR family transcriptional regulator n=1 Tax=Frankia nepalensis TaxID=1836974 RepID=A0A937RLT3_9ACTN|nr:TetR/AcrR family transcriptional regulator [Frankia nepalensis]MBL7495844.1 TetR/AcrR family transcriptional regulator [Frankia nepalensis]MBL7509920.1 TetR/AcrR family transcriptional regulator [Frankia nepalensis]MBL7523697.1 TetR/AcrR family transcriptional regulator [Frankia nepalensis]MBL7629679.1 TetR/AcrR family transcriptional regulator [Frankia nepalensis]